MNSDTNLPAEPKPLARCVECDSEVTHYNIFVTPMDEERVVCWECLARTEKGFNARRDFHRTSRQGVIPR